MENVKKLTDVMVTYVGKNRIINHYFSFVVNKFHATRSSNVLLTIITGFGNYDSFGWFIFMTLAMFMGLYFC